jgi:hypothetical protein
MVPKRLSQKARLCQPDTSNFATLVAQVLSVTGVEGHLQRIKLHFDFLPTGQAGAQCDKQQIRDSLDIILSVFL